MKKLCLTRFTFYILGILILAFGIALTIQAKLGTSPFDALLVGLSETVGLTVGSWEIIIAFIMIFCNSLLKKQKPEFLGLLTSFITGIDIDMWVFLLHHLITPEKWFCKLTWFGIGIILIGLGTAIYLYTNFAPIPIDHLTLIIQELTKMSILFSRTVIYLFFLLSAIVFNGPIGIGTVITLCLGGAILNYFMKMIEKLTNNSNLSDLCTQSKS